MFKASSQKEVSTKLTKGLLYLIILQYLSTEPMHGYQVVRRPEVWLLNKTLS